MEKKAYITEEERKRCRKVADGIFKPCWKCDYLFNHTSGKVSRGTEVEDLCLKKIKYWNSVKAVMDQQICSRFFFVSGQRIRKGEGEKCGIVTGCKKDNGA